MKKSLCRFAALAGLVLFGTALTGACSHEIQSPPPAATNQGVVPDLVCNDAPVSQPFSTVTLHGKNFTPMPSKTLEDKTER